ncbi:bifunctional molybdenum cofactor biosynthesis protein MoaC/MoaB [Nocardia asteroides NBRC 15531]|uniref:Cyclic pyranopterin monophosphate synthase n=1 Tax=Nocardia asteroides NBRC 15531 TaxID=1110697 RepID=U5E301_NOCAS|nr:bifunctional molybdenum cofactor biosynthesis protein MoaC/MoaB [Nocardia asteroides]TLF70428.1 bifunctional molybdenum cofactor biosynthesis protein MoaC/MoaB [Nocardia asteroides NBRC 15531]UGT49973.1 bifunctional molybdenum cofactor biosynthesis protein MoaC/MoaB [Nocardia asteroides]SFN23805.1 cyclic pyranopterin monophosphate synthase subunit MoaC [Nocardia asteroides]VEG37266.1 Molybdenum cofactor biosynthesis protein C [Nocardia asteroides]GAD81672.1 molybdenum cofactor biosynthesis 
MSELSHVDHEGRARMVDVSGKSDTARIAVAAGELQTTAEVVRLVRAEGMPKADVLSTARLAGIAGAKKTSELIPLCHQLALSSVKVEFGFTETTITVEATAKTTGPTGVEMEALTAVAVAGLTLHDMVKAVDPAAVMNGVRLVTKEGGKHGHWVRPEAAASQAEAGPIENAAAPADTATSESAARTAVVVVASTGAAAGTRVDTTGPVLAEWLTAQGFSVRGPLVHADADIATGLADALLGGPVLVITTGGTGASPTDATPEATRAVLDRELPGVADAIRQRGTAKFPLAALSRGVAGLAGRTVVVNLPGSPGGVKDGIAVLEPLLDHLLAQVAGGGSHD